MADQPLLFADVLFPQNINRLTYIVPAELAAGCAVGAVVEAPLRGRAKRGIIVALHKEGAPGECYNKRMSTVLKVVEGFTFPPPLLSLAQWVSHYYLSTEGLALKSLLYRDALSTLGAPGMPCEPTSSSEPGGKSDAGEPLGEVLDAVKSGGFRAFLFHASTVESELSFVAELLRRLRNVVLLLPEKYDASCFDAVFEEAPDRSIVLHGNMRARERQSALCGLFDSRYNIVAGTMQTVFAPLRDLSLIIVFREHSEFYKHEKTPMYNVRDVAVKRASLEKVPVLLTSCAPSFESYHNCQKHKYTLLRDVRTWVRPEIRIVNAAASESLITPPLRKAVGETLDSGKRALILLNRKGHSILKCEDCGHVESCQKCNVPLVYHAEAILRCHYCRGVMQPPALCPNCGSPRTKFSSTGTEKAFERLKAEFGDRVALVDSEHSGSETAELEAAGIIIGTELAMRKFSPLQRFGLTAILNADIGLQRPDFRAYERFFQLSMYLSGRNERGSVLYIQAFDWRNTVFSLVRTYDYESLYAAEIQRRAEFHYPPFYTLAVLTLRDPGQDSLRLPPKERGCEFLGPIPKKSRKEEITLLVKSRTRGTIQRCVEDVSRITGISRERLKVDIDPLVPS